MQYRIVFLAALTATGALARPALRRDDHMENNQQVPDNQQMPDNQAPQGGFADIDFSKYECPQAQAGSQSLTIDLRGPSELATQTELKSDNGKFVFCPTDVYSEISVKLSADFANKDLRCAVADENGNMIGASRGDNVDFTFSDGGEAKKWDFLLPPKENGIKTSKVVCDPEFKKIDQAQREVEEAVTVLLREQAAGTPIPIGPFKGPYFGTKAVEEERLPVEQGKTFETLEVKVGRLTNPQGLRCAAVNNKDGLSPFATRKANLDNTFSDANGGEWTFARLSGKENPASDIKEIRCDKDFVAKNRNAAPQPEQPADMPQLRK
jgi:hypothetical protein